MQIDVWEFKNSIRIEIRHRWNQVVIVNALQLFGDIFWGKLQYYNLVSTMVDFNSNAIFELPDIDLHNRILISSQNSDLKKSASSTARPKLWRPGARWRKQLQTCNWAQNVQGNYPQPRMSESAWFHQLFGFGPTLGKSPKYETNMIFKLFSYLLCIHLQFSQNYFCTDHICLHHIHLCKYIFHWYHNLILMLQWLNTDKQQTWILEFLSKKNHIFLSWECTSTTYIE